MAQSLYPAYGSFVCDAADRGVGPGCIFTQDQRKDGGRGEHILYVEDPQAPSRVFLSAHGGRYPSAYGDQCLHCGDACGNSCPPPAEYGHGHRLSGPDVPL